MCAGRLAVVLLPRQFSPNSCFLLMGTLNNTLRLWDYVAGKWHVVGLAKCLSRDARRRSRSACAGRGVMHCDARVLRRLVCPLSLLCSVKVYQGHKNDKFCAFAAFGVHDGTVLCGGEDRGVRLWDLNGQQVRQVLPGRDSPDAPGDGHCDTVVALDVHPTRRLFASGALDADRTVKVWTHEQANADEPMAER